MGIYAEQLALVRTAIKAVLESGQSVSYKGRSWTMTDLSTLRKMEIDYAQLAAQELNPKRGRNRLIYVTPTT